MDLQNLKNYLLSKKALEKNADSKELLKLKVRFMTEWKPSDESIESIRSIKI